MTWLRALQATSTQAAVADADSLRALRVCAAGVDVREAARCKHGLSRNRRLVIWRANVATRSSCLPGAEE